MFVHVEQALARRACSLLYTFNAWSSHACVKSQVLVLSSLRPSLPEACLSHSDCGRCSDCASCRCAAMNIIPAVLVLQISAGGDRDGVLDLYSVHGYPIWGEPAQDANINMFMRPWSYWGLDKPVIVGEHWDQVRCRISWQLPAAAWSWLCRDERSSQLTGPVQQAGWQLRLLTVCSSVSHHSGCDLQGAAQPQVHARLAGCATHRCALLPVLSQYQYDMTALPQLQPVAAIV